MLALFAMEISGAAPPGAGPAGAGTILSEPSAVESSSPECKAADQGQSFAVAGLVLTSAGAMRRVDQDGAVHFVPMFTWDAVRDAVAAIADHPEQVTQFFTGKVSTRGTARARHETRLLAGELAVRVDEGIGRAPLILTPAGVAYTLFEPYNIVTALGRAGWDSLEGVMNAAGGESASEFEKKLDAFFKRVPAAKRAELVTIMAKQLTADEKEELASCLQPRVSTAAPPAAGAGQYRQGKLSKIFEHLEVSDTPQPHSYHYICRRGPPRAFRH